MTLRNPELIHAILGEHESYEHDHVVLACETIAQYAAKDIFISCANCKHMPAFGIPHCNKFDMIPPIQIIAAGCEYHEDDGEIPF